MLLTCLAFAHSAAAQNGADQPAGIEPTAAADVMELERRAFEALSGMVGRLRPATAVPELTDAVMAGSSAAMAQLGHMLWDGEGMPQSRSEAVRMMRMAAERGNYQGQVFLGGMHLFGEEVERDPVQARAWFEAAANQGDPFAMFELAGLYEREEGVARDDALRFELLTRSAELGNQEARRELGILLFRDAERRDPAKAFRMLELVAEEDKDAARELGYQYLIGRHGERNLVEAARWISAAVDLGDAAATLLLADIAEQGLGVERDPALAEQLRAEIIATSTPDEKNDIAWRYAASPDEILRNGRVAVEIMEELLSSADMVSAARLDTLAAAYAEAGRFDEATATQEAAIARMSEELDPDFRSADLEAALADFVPRLDSYRSGRAYRMSP